MTRNNILILVSAEAGCLVTLLSLKTPGDLLGVEIVAAGTMTAMIVVFAMVLAGYIKRRVAKG